MDVEKIAAAREAENRGLKRTISRLTREAQDLRERHVESLAREAAAFQAGAEAMREAAADVAGHDYVTEPDTAGRQCVIRHGDPGIADAIRALPIPARKSQQP